MEKLFVFDTDQEFTPAGWEQDSEAWDVIMSLPISVAIALLLKPNRTGRVL